MIGKTFTTPHSKKDYKVIEQHPRFKSVWRCYPLEKEPPYKQTFIDCFSEEFIEKNLKQEDNDTLHLH